jgi:DNA-binding IclR family transcriptional regulator
MPPPESWFVTRTMRALEVLAFEPMSAPQLAETLGIHPRTARRLAVRLLEEGYLKRTDDARRLYSPSMRIVALAGQIVQHAELPRVAAPFVERLSARGGGPAHLMIPSYRDALCLVHRANGTGPAHPRLGELVPSHCTAAGKALLGHRAPWRESVLAAPLAAFTDRTITDPARLRQETELARERGYAVEDGEHRAGVRVVAAPVFAPGGEAVAAISVTAGEDESVEELAGVVVATAGELTARLADG